MVDLEVGEVEGWGWVQVVSRCHYSILPIVVSGHGIEMLRPASHRWRGQQPNCTQASGKVRRSECWRWSLQSLRGLPFPGQYRAATAILGVEGRVDVLLGGCVCVS